MDACQLVSDHIHALKGSPNTYGSWTFNRKSSKHAPNLYTLCVPDPSEIEAVAETLRTGGNYKD